MLLKRAPSISQAFPMCVHDKRSASAKYISLTVYTLQGVIALIKHLPLEKLGALKLLQKNTDKYPNKVKGDEHEPTHLPQNISIWKREPKRSNIAQPASFSRSKICYVHIFYVQIQNIHFVFVPSKKTLYLFQYPGKPLNHSVSISQETRW